MKYTNHLGETIDFDGECTRCGTGGFSDWAFEAVTLNGRTAAFAHPQAAYTIDLAVTAYGEAQGLALRDAICDVATADIDAVSPGTLEWDGWSTSCYITSSAKDLYWMTGRAAKYSLGVVCDDPVWMRESRHAFPKQPEEAGGGVGFPLGFPFDYGCDGHVSYLDNPSISRSPFRMVVYGPAEDPIVNIGGNKYEVDATVPEGGLLVIDGLHGTIVLRAIDGTESNAWHLRRGTQKRGSGSYAMQPVPPGVSDVQWDGSFGFDLTLYECRYERRWNG